MESLLASRKVPLKGLCKIGLPVKRHEQKLKPSKMFVKCVQQGILRRYMERFIQYMEYFCYGNKKFLCHDQYGDKEYPNILMEVIRTDFNQSMKRLMTCTETHVYSHK